MATGFLEGYLGVREDQRQQADSQVRDALNTSLTLENNLKIQEQQRQQQVRQQKIAQAAQIPAGLPLSQKYDKLADMLFGTDPDASLQFSDDALKLSDREFKLAEAKKEQLQKDLEEGSNVASGVTDQNGVQALFDWANQTGTKLPPWVPKVYDESTAPSFQRLGKMFMSAKDRETLLRTQEQIDYQKRRETKMDTDAEQRDRRLDQIDRNQSRLDALAQAKMDKDEKAAQAEQEKRKARLNRPPTFTELESLMSTLSNFGESEGIKMPKKYSDDHLAMAREVYKTKNSLLFQDETMDPAEAEDEAIRQVSARVKDGKFKPSAAEKKVEPAKPDAAPAPAAKPTGDGSQANPYLLDTPDKIALAKGLPKGAWLTAPGRKPWQKPN